MLKLVAAAAMAALVVSYPFPSQAQRWATGCLMPDGTLRFFKEGQNPLQSCRNGQVLRLLAEDLDVSTVHKRRVLSEPGTVDIIKQGKRRFAPFYGYLELEGSDSGDGHCVLNVAADGGLWAEEPGAHISDAVSTALGVGFGVPPGSAVYQEPSVLVSPAGPAMEVVGIVVDFRDGLCVAQAEFRRAESLVELSPGS